jgi:hypothetical protein
MSKQHLNTFAIATRLLKSRCLAERTSNIAGAISLSSSSHLLAIVGSRLMKPVTLPPVLDPALARGRSADGSAAGNRASGTISSLTTDAFFGFVLPKLAYKL